MVTLRLIQTEKGRLEKWIEKTQDKRFLKEPTGTLQEHLEACPDITIPSYFRLSGIIQGRRVVEISSQEKTTCHHQKIPRLQIADSRKPQ